jgi:hypothetical protein
LNGIYFGNLVDHGGSLHKCRNITLVKEMTTEMVTKDLFARLPAELHVEIIKRLTFHGLFWARGINRFYLIVCLQHIRSEYISKYIVPEFFYQEPKFGCSSWMQLQSPQVNACDDVYLWKRSSTNQRSAKFELLIFHLYDIVGHDFIIVNNRVDLGEVYVGSPELQVRRKSETVKDGSKNEIHGPMAQFWTNEFSWSGTEASGYTAVWKEDEDRAPPGGRNTTCKCIRGKVEEYWGVRGTASWEIEIPLFILYRHLQGVTMSRQWSSIPYAWWLPEA